MRLFKTFCVLLTLIVLTSCKEECIYTYEFEVETEHGDRIKGTRTITIETDKEQPPTAEAEAEALEFVIFDEAATKATILSTELKSTICE